MNREAYPGSFYFCSEFSAERSGFGSYVFIRNRIAKRFGILQHALGHINIRAKTAHSEDHAAKTAVMGIDSKAGNAIGFKHIDFQFIAHIL